MKKRFVDDFPSKIKCEGLERAEHDDVIAGNARLQFRMRQLDELWPSFNNKKNVEEKKTKKEEERRGRRRGMVVIHGTQAPLANVNKFHDPISCVSIFHGIISLNGAGMNAYVDRFE